MNYMFEDIPKKILGKGEYLNNKPFTIRRNCLVCKKMFKPKHPSKLYCPDCSKKKR